MRLLLDTHTLLWWFDEDPALSVKARNAIAANENQVAVSVVSAWEMAIKTKAGKLRATEVLSELPEALEDEGFLVLPISLTDALRAGLLHEHHKDPFDRMLVAQAQGEELAILSNDPIFDRYGIQRIW